PVQTASSPDRAVAPPSLARPRPSPQRRPAESEASFREPSLQATPGEPERPASPTPQSHATPDSVPAGPRREFPRLGEATSLRQAAAFQQSQDLRPWPVTPAGPRS